MTEYAVLVVHSQRNQIFTFLTISLGKYHFFYHLQVKISKYFERKIVNIFLSIIFNICFGYSKELSHFDGSFEY